VNELVIVGCVGEGGNAILRHVNPIGNADRVADFCSDFV
jgi:hypothetical protein